MMKALVFCSNCNKRFPREVRRINENQKLKHRRYCSPECLKLARTKRTELSCESPGCLNKFWRHWGDISKHNFCCHSCAAKFTNHQRRAIKTCTVCDKQIQIHLTYCSPRCFGKMRKFSKETLVSKLKELATKLERSPTRREFHSSASCAKIFGSWNKALLAAGLIPHRSLNQRMYCRRVCFAKDGHKCDSVSEMIIDNWMAQHEIPHSKETSYPEGQSTADWSIGPQIFVEYFGLANDSKRYDLAIRTKRQICKKAKIQLIEIYSKDLFPTNRLKEAFHFLLPPLLAV